MPNYSFIWGVNSISLLPIPITHPNLFPLEVVFIRTVMASICYQVASAEAVVSRCYWTFKRPDDLVRISLYRAALPGRHTIFSDIIKRHHYRWPRLVMIYASFTVQLEGASIDRNHWELSSITTVKLSDQSEVPTVFEAMMTIKLKLISFTIIVLLHLVSSIIAIFSLFMWNFLKDESRCIRHSWH